MNEQNSAMKVIGPLIGVVILIYVINIAINQYYDGTAAIQNSPDLKALTSAIVAQTDSTENLADEAAADTDSATNAESIAPEEAKAETDKPETEDSTDAEETAASDGPSDEAVATAASTQEETAEAMDGEATEEETVNTTGEEVTEEETADDIEVAFVSRAISKGACSACHMIPGIEGAVGEIAPNLSTIGIDAATRVEGLNAEAYIRQSILEPSAFIAPECPTDSCMDGVMPLGLANRMNEEELDSIVHYLLTLEEKVELPIAPTSTESTTGSDEAGIDYNALSNIVTKGTCGACHVIPNIGSAMGLIGPDLSTIGRDAGTRIGGYSAEAYLRESVEDPNAFIAPECPMGSCTSGIMPMGLADQLTEEEFDMLINYLLLLTGS